jgi:uncharacterized protein YjiS (DUF1127 family)
MAELQQCGWHRFIAPPHIVQRSIMCSGVYGMSVLHLLSSAWEAFANWRRRERAYDELMALDDHALADIGIRRSEIRAICEGSLAPGRSGARLLSPRSGTFSSPEAHLVWPSAKP